MSMEAIGSVFLLGVIVEALIEIIKGWFSPTTKLPGWLWPALGAVLGIVLCMLTGVDLLKLAGLNINPPVIGTIFTGLLISRGASFIHDLWKRIGSGGAPIASTSSTTASTRNTK